MLLTSRGGPSSSPMLIVVDLDSERAEPEDERMLANGKGPSYDVTRGRCGEAEGPMPALVHQPNRRTIIAGLESVG